jgi:hypothetical protein
LAQELGYFALISPGLRALLESALELEADLVDSG